MLLDHRVDFSCDWMITSAGLFRTPQPTKLMRSGFLFLILSWAILDLELRPLPERQLINGRVTCQRGLVAVLLCAA